MFSGSRILHYKLLPFMSLFPLMLFVLTCNLTQAIPFRCVATRASWERLLFVRMTPGYLWWRKQKWKCPPKIPQACDSSSYPLSTTLLVSVYRMMQNSAVIFDLDRKCFTNLTFPFFRSRPRQPALLVLQRSSWYWISPFALASYLSPKQQWWS